MSRDWSQLLWREKTWGERVQTSIAFVVACVIGLGMFVVGLWALGSTVDGITQYKTEHDRCLKHATNGYEIKQCR